MSDLNIENSTPETAPAVETVVEQPVVVETPEIKEEIVETPKVEKPKEEPIITEPKVSSKNIVLYSLKDFTIPGLGSLKKGYNTVPENKANKWLEKNSVRLATEQEIKTYLK